MGAKSKKAKQADKKARVAEKQERKSVKKDKRHAKKTGKDDGADDDDDDDIDTILAEFARKQEQFMKVTETAVAEPPSARSSCTMIGSPANANELFLFGGESFDGSYARFYNDLFVYNIKHDRWSAVTSGNSPLPRSGHAWCRGGNAGGIYLFGGEFSSPKQGTFHHYKDFWYLDPSAREWTRLEGKGPSPSARSGHRMTYFKNYIILFGGFQDTAQTTKYLSDLWIYDCLRYCWHQPQIAGGKPDARSSFTLLPHEGGAVLYGGYSREKVPVPTSRKSGAVRMATKPVVHQDSWFLRIVPAETGADAPAVRWERRKRPGAAPSPARIGATMAPHKGRGVLFGGVHDTDESDEGITSDFFNDLFVWNVDRNRFVQLHLRKARPKAAAVARASRRDRARANEEELRAQLAALEMRAGHDLDDLGIPESESEEEEAEGAAEKPVVFEMPHRRFNACLAVQGDVLYIFGGTIEGDAGEHCFEDMYAVHLDRLDGVKHIYKTDMPADWDKESEDEDDDDDDEDDDDDDDNDDEEDGDEEEDGHKDKDDPRSARGASPSESSKKPTADDIAQRRRDKAAKKAEPDAPADEEEDSADSTTLPTPRPFESLREFYARTVVEWQTLGTDTEHRSVKEIRKQAFTRAEERWWACRDEIRALEDEQEDAGIGEVVNISSQPNSSSQAGPRRR